MALSLLLGGCREEGSVRSNGESVVEVGVICPLTGVNAAAGEDMKAGVMLALEIINGRFDLPLPLAAGEGLPNQGGARIRAVFKDTGGSPEQAVQLVEELARVNCVAAILGEYSSTVTAAASEHAETVKIPFLNAASTSPTLTQRGLKWFFRITPDDEIFAENFFLFLSDLGVRYNSRWPKRLILVFENRLWGTSVARAERKLAARHGYEVVEEVPYDAAQEDFDAELERIRSSLPGVVFQASYDRDAISLLQGYRRMGINPVAILGMNAGFISPGFLSALGEDAEHVMSREVWSLDLAARKPLVNAVNTLFFERFGRNMTGNSARSFTGMLVLADALNRALSREASSIRAALLRTDLKSEQLIMPWDGVRFDERTNQNVLGKGIIVQVQGGQYWTVWPWDLAVKEPIWPGSTAPLP
jgi:branched-chain amino acid transport system substrate-binding protein